MCKRCCIRLLERGSGKGVASTLATDTVFFHLRLACACYSLTDLEERWPSMKEIGISRTRGYEELCAKEVARKDCALESIRTKETRVKFVEAE
jgi:hypothetical protein